MGCLCAIKTDEYHGFECSISGGACMYPVSYTHLRTGEVPWSAAIFKDDSAFGIYLCGHGT